MKGYTVWWWRGWDNGGGKGEKISIGEIDANARWWRVGGEVRGAALRGLACGAPYYVAMRAHNAVGASAHSRPVILHTRGES